MGKVYSSDSSKIEVIKKRVEDNAYLSLPTSDLWKELVEVLTDGDIRECDTIDMDQFSEEDCDGLQLDYITIFNINGDLTADTNKGYVYLPDAMKDEDDIYALIDILRDGLV